MIKDVALLVIGAFLYKAAEDAYPALKHMLGYLTRSKCSRCRGRKIVTVRYLVGGARILCAACYRLEEAALDRYLSASLTELRG